MLRGVPDFELYLNYAPNRVNYTQRRRTHIGYFYPRSESPDLGHPIFLG